MHTAAPVTLKLPIGQTTAVPLVDPAGHEYPAVHRPLHCAVTCPADEPYQPASHGPEHVGVVSPVAAPYCPLGHALQFAAPTGENWPAGHS